MIRKIPPFHIAIPVYDIFKAENFYGKLLKCAQGRRSKTNKWVDYNFFGHQLVCHVTPPEYIPKGYCNPVDGDEVPVPHFGLCLQVDQWKQVRDLLIESKINFIVQPHLRFSGEAGQQYTMFFKDPFGNNIELKAMTNPDNLFAKYETE